MNEPFSEELLSAYLDGELPSDERLRVEEWLAASADHQKLFDDLQTLRRELQALPKQSLDTGFSDRVLAAIRQRNPAALPQGGSSSEPTPPPVMPASIEKNKVGMPAWRWFAAGVAATLLAVIVGVNAAPETMAKIGMLPQLAQDKPNAKVLPASTEPQATSPVAVETESPKYAEDENSTEALAKADLAKARLPENQRAEANQNAGRGSSNPPAPPKEADRFADARFPPAADTDAVGTERQDAKAFANAAPSAPSAAAPGVARMAAMSPDRAEKKKAEGGQGDNRKQIAAADQAADDRPESTGAGFAPVAARDARPIDRVVQVTAKQATDALAMATLRRRVHLDAQVLEQSKGYNKTEGESGNRQLQQAGQSGVQIDALEITGPEHEVANLLAALGLDLRNQLASAAVIEEKSADKGNRGGGNGMSARANLAPAKPAKPGEQAATGDREAASGGSGYAAAKSGSQAKRAVADGAAGKGMEADKSQGNFGFKSGDPGEQRIVRVKLIVGSEAPPATAVPTQK